MTLFDKEIYIMFAKQLQQTCLNFRFALRRNVGSVAAASTTIYALSSGRGKSGIAVVRVSGPDTGSVLVQLLDRRSLPQPRRASLRVVHDPLTKEKIDKGIVLWMPGPHTFTGDDLAELHIHGGQAVVNAVLHAVGRVPRTRLAEPGEFTRRSFLNGKIDLTEAEGIADVIHAETEAQRRQAFRQMDGDLRRKFSDLRQRLMTARAHLEAFIDFSEEEHLEPDILDKVKRAVTSVQDDLKEYLTDNRRGERLRNGVHGTIVGEPNVGKSSLLNAICQKPAAIVSPIAGTTRDVVESAFDLGSYPVLLSDTAGLRETEDVVESEGVRRAVSRAASSDLIVLVMDATQFSHVTPSSLDSPDSFVRSQLISFGIQPEENQRAILLVNKIDLVPDELVHQWRTSLPKEYSFLSCTTNTGMKECTGKLTEMVEEMCGNPLVGEASLTQHRHRSNLEACAERLQRFQELLDSTEDVTLATHEIQQALRFLGKVTGHVYVEEVLDVIFRDFCIGK